MTTITLMVISFVCGALFLIAPKPSKTRDIFLFFFGITIGINLGV